MRKARFVSVLEQPYFQVLVNFDPESKYTMRELVIDEVGTLPPRSIHQENNKKKRGSDPASKHFTAVPFPFLFWFSALSGR